MSNLVKEDYFKHLFAIPSFMLLVTQSNSNSSPPSQVDLSTKLWFTHQALL